MTHRAHIQSALCLMATAFVFAATLRAEEKPEEFERQYWADARAFSLHPGQELATYRGYPSGGVGPNGTLGLGVSDKQRQFNVSIEAKLKSGRFLAHVTVKPQDDDKQTQAREVDYDLSDLVNQSLEIARDDDGRVYRVSILPRIEEHPQPRQFTASERRYEYFGFPSSPVVLNDMDYVGRLAMSSGQFVFCDIAGLARVEFSLLHLKDAKPEGTLKDGVITITHGDTTLRISDVKNGVDAETLRGGPYKIWVRWKPPTMSVEEYRKELTQRIASLKRRIKDNDLTLSPGTIERLEKMSASGRIGLSENGLRGVEPEDLVEE
jgi:hypothetical protein